MITADYHVHSNFSTDSEEKMESMIEKAISLGMKRICFTDHMDYDYPGGDENYFTFQIEEYFRKLSKLTDCYKEHIKVLKGIELGLMPYLKERYENLLHNYSFDFVIGSSHLVNGKDPYDKEFWENITEREGYETYFQTIVDNLETYDDFDTYGHIDYIVRYGPNKNKDYTYEKYSNVLEKVLKLLISKEKALEINTAGYKYGLSNAHPQIDVLKRYRELGGNKITIGSDAHKAEHLAYHFEETCCMLKEIGFCQYVIFENRKSVFLNL